LAGDAGARQKTTPVVEAKNGRWQRQRRRAGSDVMPERINDGDVNAQ